MDNSLMNNIFNIKEVNASSGFKNMELLYELEHGSPGCPGYLREQVLCSKAGRYYMSVKCGEKASCFRIPSCGFAGREVFFPAAPEALALWAGENLHGDARSRAQEEFGGGAKIREKVWEYQQGADKTQPGFIFEYLRKTDTGTYALFSTDGSYPYFGCSAAVVKGSQTVRDDLYLYYITAGAAKRWAEARGMDEYTCKEVFGSGQ